MKVSEMYCFSQKEVLLLPAPNEGKFERSDMVIFSDSENKEEAGKILAIERESRKEDVVLDGAILRKMTPRDIQVMETNLERGKNALDPARQKISKYGLDMQLFDAAYSFDGGRINFIFTAEDRVDFRDLVKDLAKHFQKQIHLKQIGPRDKSRVVGGFGRCGRQFCCTTFLPGLESISMDMVRDQGLMNKGSSKLSGGCGKLLCCLKYEVDEYRRLRKSMPPMYSAVKSKDCEGKVMGTDVLNQKVKVMLADRNIVVVNVADIKSVVPQVRIQKEAILTE